jgi:CheY-like chemotaxis protein
MSINTTQAIDTVRLSASERKQLIDCIEQGCKSVSPDRDRRSMRVNIDLNNVVLEIYAAHGEKIRFAVQTRNISNRGLAVIHGRYIHDGACCRAYLPQINDVRVHAIEGRIVRSRHLRGLLHEVVMVFDHPVDLTRFVKLNAFQMQRNLRDRGDDRAGHIVVAMMGPNHKPIKYALTPKSLDEGSLSFHHGIHFALGMPCMVGLPCKDGTQLNRMAHVRSNQKIEQGIAVITVDFEKPVDCSRIATTMEQMSHVKPQARRALVVAHRQEDAIDIAQRIRTMGIDQFEWSLPEKAANVVKNDTDFEVVLVDADHQAVLDQIQLPRLMRDAGYQGPLVILASNRDLESHCQSLANGSSAFLIKPVQTAQLRQVLVRLLQVDLMQNTSHHSFSAVG